jgi:alpha-glucosidase
VGGPLRCRRDCSAGRRWHLSRINGRKTPQTIKAPLAFLGGGPFALSLITDGATPAEFAHVAREVGAQDELEIRLAGRGGFAARLTPKR